MLRTSSHPTRSRIEAWCAAAACAALLAAGCGSTPNSTPAAGSEGRSDPAEIIWAEQATAVDPGSYEVVGTLKKRTTWCGVTPAISDSKNHQALATKAARLGADAIFLSCGAPGTVGQCICTARAIRWTAGAPGTALACTPGETQRCFGNGACEGAQVCLPEGTGWGPCSC